MLRKGLAVRRPADEPPSKKALAALEVVREKAAVIARIHGGKPDKESWRFRSNHAADAFMAQARKAGLPVWGSLDLAGLADRDFLEDFVDDYADVT